MTRSRCSRKVPALRRAIRWIRLVPMRLALALLVFVFGVPAQTAVGTDLLYAAITKSAGAVTHGLKHNIDWQIVRRLLCGSIPAALLTVLLLRSNWIAAVEDRFILGALGWALIVTGIAQLARSALHRWGKQVRTVRPSQFRGAQPALTVLAGVVLGVLVTLTSIGAGALGAAALTYLYPYRLTPLRLVATDIAHAIPLALVAGAGHLALGNVNFGLLGWLLLGSVPGIVLGSALASRSPERVLRILIATILTIIGARLIF